MAGVIKRAILMSLQINLTLKHALYQINTASATSLAIAVNFNQPTQQPNHFSANAAQATPMQADGFIGDTQQGGSCNVNELTINPHCNGTHTETIAHICDFPINDSSTKNSEQLGLTLSQISIPAFMPCAVISILPIAAKNSGENYSPHFNASDLIISRSSLEKALVDYHNEQLQALVIRSLPNDHSKHKQAYTSAQQPAFFSREAIQYLNERGVEHLVVDLPSIDRLHDDGLMTCHHLFWQVEEGSHNISQHSLAHKTITEMAFIDNDISDGFYFINIQTPAFHNDAAPSRPVIFTAKEMSK